VEKAKELLEEGASVNDAAVGSGYLDAKALTRAFKRYEGITPGAYRDSRK
jgi:AraC-like DNA-binding protein